MEDDSTCAPPQRPESLLPYDLWTEDALRQVVMMALAYVAEHGLPGEHHFYISFRTDARGVMIPPRLSTQYPHEMTIVLQHQFWDLKLNERHAEFSVGLTFGGVPATLTIPFSAITGFADPHVQFGLRFRPPGEEIANDEAQETQDAEAQVVSLDAFRKRTPSKDQ
jgi:uncharacterized protein